MNNKEQEVEKEEEAGIRSGSLDTCRPRGKGTLYIKNKARQKRLLHEHTAFL